MTQPVARPPWSTYHEKDQAGFGSGRALDPKRLRTWSVREHPRFSKRKKELEDAARSTLQKDKWINIRIFARDLLRLQMQAAREGVPYQTYIASSLHKIVSGRLKEVQ